MRDAVEDSGTHTPTIEDVRNVCAKGLRPHAREKALGELLGTIKGISMLGFKGFVFTSRVTTSRMVLRIEVAMDRMNLASEVQNYDCWSELWRDHASRMLSLFIVKRFIDAGDLLGASLVKAMRNFQLTEKDGDARDMALAIAEDMGLDAEDMTEKSMNLATKFVEAMEEEEKVTTSQRVPNPFDAADSTDVRVRVMPTLMSSFEEHRTAAEVHRDIFG